MAASKTSKVWKATSTSPSGVQVTEENAALVGSKEHFVIADKQGVFIHGPVSFVADAAHRRTGGMFTGINDFLHMIPSTIVTVIPNQTPSPPLFAITNLLKDVAHFTAFLG